MTTPILLSSCALATTAGEAAYRIQRPVPPRRGARAIALDAPTDAVLRRAAGHPWNAARFLSVVPGPAGTGGVADAVDTGPRRSNGTAAPVRSAVAESTYDLALFRPDGELTGLAAELADADVVIMLAAEGDTAEAADAIGRACHRRGIMTAGVVLATGHGDRERTLLALRPHAQVLLVSQDDGDLVELLTALRG